MSMVETLESRRGENGYFPSHQEIAKGASIARSALARNLRILEFKRRIRHGAGRRIWRVR